MFCSNCGKNIPDKAMFCPGCGKAVAMTPVVQNETIPSAETEPGLNNQPESLNFQEPMAYVQQAPAYAEQQVPAFVQQQASAPEPPLAVVAPKKPPLKKEGEKQKQKISQVLLSALICIFIFVFMLVTFGIVTVREAGGSENVRQLPSEIDPVTVLEAMDNNQIESGDESDVRRAYNKMEIKDFLADVLAMISNYIFDDGKLQEIDPEDVYYIIMEDSELLHDKTGYSLDSEDVAVYLNDDGEELIYNLSSKDGEFVEIYDKVGIFCSKWIVAILILIQMGLLVLLFKIQKWSIRTLSWIGATVIAGALTYMIVFGMFGSQLITSALQYNELLYELINVVMDLVFWFIIKLGLILIAIGGVMIVTHIVTGKIRKSKRSTAAA